MAYNDYLRNNVTPTALTLTGATAGTIVAGPRLMMSSVARGTLSARCVVDAETSTITLAAVWEVSDDGTTWREARGYNNASPVVLATGTAGADAAVTRNLDAPNAVYGHRFARCSIQVGVTTGQAADTATVSYDFCDAYADG